MLRHIWTLVFEMKKTTLSLALSALLPVAIAATSIQAAVTQTTTVQKTTTQTTNTKPVEIVITAKSQQSVAEVAATSHVITSADIERSQANDITDILDTISGVSITRNGGRGAVSSTFIRGASARQIVVLIDGIRVSSATLGSTNLGHIPIDIIERIEVVKGPLSGLYGADAVGGVIQIFTKKGGENENNIEIQAGSFGHQKVIAGLNTSHFRASVSREKNDGIDATTTLIQGNDDDDGFEETAINLGGSFAFNDSTTLAVNAFFADNEIEFDNQFGADAGRSTQNEIASISATLDNNISEKVTWSTTLGLTNNDSLTEAFSSRFDTKRLSLSTQGVFQLSNNGSAVIGLDYYDEEIETNSNFAVTDRDNTGLFGQYQNKYGKLGVVANLRIDDNSAYGDETNGSLALSYPLSSSTRLTASYGTSFSAPTFNALYFPGFGNVNIQPEESETIELSLRGNSTNIQWRISAYDTEIENLIESPAPNFIAINTNEASLQGIEFEIGTTIAHWNIASSLNLLDATDEATGNGLIRRPEQTLKLSANRQFGKLSIGADLLAENGRFDQGEELDSFERFDLRTSYKVTEKFIISAKAGNITDEDYELAKSFNTEGRSLLVSGKMNF